MPQNENVPTTQSAPEPCCPPDEYNCCYSTAAASIAVAEAVAVATAEASAYASAYAGAFVQVAVAIAILIAIAIVIAIVIAVQVAAIAIAAAAAVAVAVAVAIAVAIAAAVALTRRLRQRQLHRCTVLLDLPSTSSVSNPAPPAIVWEVIHASGAAKVDILESHDGGVTFSPVGAGLPLIGSLLWQGAKQFKAGTLFLVMSVALDASGREVCRSRTRSLRLIP